MPTGHTHAVGTRVPVAGGYMSIRAPGHARAWKKSGSVLEHILVVEKALGHPLRASAPIHHVDGDCANNAPSNLVACNDAAYHQLLHMRQAAYDATGDADQRRCGYCQSYDTIGRMVVHAPGRASAQYCHRECRSQYNRARRGRIA